MRQTFGLSLALLIVSTTAMAKPGEPGHDQANLKSNPGKAAAGKAAAHGKPAQAKPAKSKTAAASKAAAGKSADRHHAARGKPAGEPKAAPPDQYIGPVQVVGAREIGRAAWYGGYHLGRRTASGDRLDARRLTCAHRSLPLHSLVRVTNLSNGRSVIATITDRGPVSQKLLIDVSPKVADGLDMRRQGIAQVAVEPVALTTAAQR